MNVTILRFRHISFYQWFSTHKKSENAVYINGFISWRNLSRNRGIKIILCFSSQWMRQRRGTRMDLKPLKSPKWRCYKIQVPNNKRLLRNDISVAWTDSAIWRKNTRQLIIVKEAPSKLQIFPQRNCKTCMFWNLLVGGGLFKIWEPSSFDSTFPI